VRLHDAVGTEQAIAVPSAATTGPQQPGVRCRSKRTEGYGHFLRVGAHAGSIGARVVLGREHSTLLEPYCRADFRCTRAYVDRDCTPISLATLFIVGRMHCSRVWQVAVRVVAAYDGESVGYYPPLR